MFSDSLFINQEIDGGNTSHLSHNSTLAHFGLGKRKIIDSLKVIWPGGEITKMNQIKTNQKIDVDVEKLGGKIDKIYWVLLTVAGSAVISKKNFI